MLFEGVKIDLSYGYVYSIKQNNLNTNYVYNEVIEYIKNNKIKKEDF